MQQYDSSIASLLSDLEDRLYSRTDTPRLDAQVLLAHILNQPRSWLLAHQETHLTQNQQENLTQAVSRLENGEPLPYVLGHWEFFGLDFQVNPHVLIPRPETELLVEYATHWLRANPDRRRAADVATGSGCIAISLAVAVPDLHVLATDISLQALDIAKSNARQHNLAKRITFLQADLLDFNPLDRFDLICANLPYIPNSILPSLRVSQYEPLLALNGGLDGIELIRRIIHTAPSHIKPGGIMFLEIEASQGHTSQSLARKIFPNAIVQVHPDLAGNDRLLEIQLNH